jgi:hypothetical protein
MLPEEPLTWREIKIIREMLKEREEEQSRCPICNGHCGGDGVHCPAEESLFDHMVIIND